MRYIHKIHINKIRHLQNIDIPIENDTYPHLILTGKNGSGKTSVLEAVANHLQNIANDPYKDFLSVEQRIKYYQDQLNNGNNSVDNERSLENNKKQYASYFGEVKIDFYNIDDFISKYQKGNFIIAFYQANRKVVINEPLNPTKPAIKEVWSTKEMATREFLNFLSDLKIQGALARNEKLDHEADLINTWFVDFEKLLKKVFQDDSLQLLFNYKDYSFQILTQGKTFKFTEMSDGFAAVLEIIIDLILKMQRKDTLTRAYQQEGIVLIDEVETHLHLELQRLVLPLLTQLFPNIQFIVTTHSPFVLNSIGNAVAFDLEHQQLVDDLTEYSYESLAEGYFGVRTSSSYTEMQLDKLKKLLEKETLLSSEKSELKSLIHDFDKIPEVVSPLIVGEYLRLKNKYIAVINSLEV
ncbi:AAA family ATPase [Capnocytophaga gingivalis]|jgi:ATPase|uniref:AAA family ATPase n=1 Tax=Capnocytophaga gingivalis TaxID=1017 RepID=A0ABU5ZBP4_9FLAO|nr:AAA family ATPase [Capnocytophaga gingivalis]MEB3076405.1 AAA family ATPase [Capnocytophaga gingivalis]